MKGKEPGREKVCMALGPQNQKTVRLEKKKTNTAAQQT